MLSGTKINAFVVIIIIVTNAVAHLHFIKVQLLNPDGDCVTVVRNGPLLLFTKLDVLNFSLQVRKDMIDQVPGQASFDVFVIRMDDVSFHYALQCFLPIEYY